MLWGKKKNVIWEENDLQSIINVVKNNSLSHLFENHRNLCTNFDIYVQPLLNK